MFHTLVGLIFMIVRYVKLSVYLIHVPPRDNACIIKCDFKICDEIELHFSKIL